jgi:hypothetical protein
MSLYDGRIPGAIYGGIGAFVAGSVIGFVGHRWKPWVALAISLVGGVLFAALGATLER